MKKQERRAEDILSDDFGIGVPNTGNYPIDEEDQLASEIYTTINNEKQQLTPTAKEQLGIRIGKSDIRLY